MWLGCVLCVIVYHAHADCIFVAYVIDFASDAQIVSEVAPQEPAHAHAH